jgi:hypothetical protein
MSASHTIVGGGLQIKQKSGALPIFSYAEQLLKQSVALNHSKKNIAESNYVDYLEATNFNHVTSAPTRHDGRPLVVSSQHSHFLPS